MHERSASTETAPQELTCDLCIVGAGIAGMNALFAASRYLSAQDKVILVDQRSEPGGMWNETYRYVRLHQPHQMFTAGNIPWTLGAKPEYLATRNEVLDQFAHCIRTLQSRVKLEQRYGYEYISHEEVSAGSAGAEALEVRILCHSTTNGEPLVIKAKRCVKALGFRIPQNLPLAFSSANVRSVSPDSFDFTDTEMRDSAKPIYIVGGGKTAMDTAYMLIKQYPHKEINLVIGKGTVFTMRDKTFVTGLKRWWGGKTSLETFLDVGMRFDGNNEDEMIAYFRSNYATQLNSNCRQFVFGVLSTAENEVISRGVRDVTMDYLNDIEDDAGNAVMVFRSGERRLIEAGSWIVNCSGYVMREPHPYEPYLSQKGAVVSIQPTSAIHFLTTFGSYFLVHLFYLNKLKELPLYELDMQALNSKNKGVLPFAAIAHLLYNITLIVEAVPARVMLECGLDFDRWFPLHRRLIAVAKLRRNGTEKAAHFRAALDTVRQRFDVKCGLLQH